MMNLSQIMNLSPLMTIQQNDGKLLKCSTQQLTLDHKVIGRRLPLFFPLAFAAQYSRVQPAIITCKNTLQTLVSFLEFSTGTVEYHLNSILEWCSLYIRCSNESINIQLWWIVKMFELQKVRITEIRNRLS